MRVYKVYCNKCGKLIENNKEYGFKLYLPYRKKKKSLSGELCLKCAKSLKKIIEKVIKQ